MTGPSPTLAGPMGTEGDEPERESEPHHHLYDLRAQVRAARARRRLGPEQRHEIARQLYYEDERRRPYLRRFATLSTLSVLIATYGIAADSAPVVIGAMLIAPLMTPLLGLAAALVTGQPWRQLESALIVIAAGAGSVGVAFVATALLSNGTILLEQSNELFSRTSPSTVDLLIGLAAGAAGAYVTVHKENLSALPGAAIAVALIPPLAVIGASLELGRSDLAAGALLLYLTNLAAIVLSAAIVFIVTGVVARRPEGAFSHRTRIGLATAVVGVLIVSYPLGKVTDQTVAEASDQNTARDIAEDWIGDLELAIVGVEVDGDDVRIDVVGSDRPSPVELLEADLDSALGGGVVVTVPWIKSENLGAPLPEPLELPAPGAGP